MTQPARSRPRPVFALLLAFAASAGWLAVPGAAREDDGKNQPPAEKGGPANPPAEKGQPPAEKGSPPAEKGSPKGKPGGEEEEAGPKKPPKKIDPDENPTPPPTPPANPPTTLPPTEPGGPEPPPEAPSADGVYLVKFDALVRAGTAARNATIRDYYKTFPVAFDRLTDKTGKVVRVTPLPPRWGSDRYPAEFGVAIIDDTNSAGEAEQMLRKNVRRIDHFEQVALDETDKLLKSTATPRPSAAESLEAAEQVLSAVLFFHDTAREQNRRRGKSWDPLKAQLYDKLTTVRVARLRQAGQDRDWTKLNTLFKRAAELYKANPKVLEQVYAARLIEAEQLVRSDKIAELEKGRELLNEFDSRFPKSQDELAEKIRKSLTEQAKTFLDQAERLAATDQGKARNLLQAVEAISPDSQSVRKLQNQLRSGYPTLVVGTRRMPERMSPALARFDSEQQAVELMFEGLMEALPDEQSGVRFRSALAAGRPLVGGGIRDVQLVRSAGWGLTGQGAFDASDVVGTLRLFRTRPTSWAADAAFWLDEPGSDPNDPGRLRLRFRVGHPYPLALMSAFKVHPANWLLERNKQIDDLEFAQRPFGTGPYRLDPQAAPRQPDGPPKDVVFVANPSYASRPGRMAQPFIKEIRFTDITQVTDLSAEFRAGRLHVLTDVPTADLPNYTRDNNLGGRVRVTTAAANRRVHILAINHRNPALQNADLRRGLLHAIDREKVLTDVYRGVAQDFHKALSGPFPAGCWATPLATGATPATLFNPDAAQSRLRAFLASPGAVPVLKLSYMADDPQARPACERMKAMIEATTATDERKLSVLLDPVPPREFLNRVETLHDFDLAYRPFDYRDDLYPQQLGSLLDPDAASAGGRNYFGYLTKETTPSEPDQQLGRLLVEVRAYCEPARLDQFAHQIHRKFNEAVPFVPLWQLDRHVVMSTAVKVWIDGRVDEASPRLLNPTTLFQSVGSWRVE